MRTIINCVYNSGVGQGHETTGAQSTQYCSVYAVKKNSPPSVAGWQVKVTVHIHYIHFGCYSWFFSLLLHQTCGGSSAGHVVHQTHSISFLYDSSVKCVGEIPLSTVRALILCCKPLDGYSYAFKMRCKSETPPPIFFFFFFFLSLSSVRFNITSSFIRRNFLWHLVQKPWEIWLCSKSN